MNYIREDFSTIAFKASTQNSSRLAQAKIDLKAEDAVINTSKCVGADTLLSLLANYCRIKKVKISVGVVGLTKVGNSSLINSLKRHRACPTSLTPGAIQEVQVDSKVKLHDYPGMVLASGNMTDSSVALRNTIKTENQACVLCPVSCILYPVSCILYPVPVSCKNWRYPSPGG